MPPQPATAAIDYRPEGFSTGGSRVLGRQSAGSGFLSGLFRHGSADTFYCLAPSADDFSQFAARLAEVGQSEKSARWITPDRMDQLSVPGCLYHPAPGIGQLAWRRRFGDPRAYSLCGVTHTTCSAAVLDAQGDLLLAPVQPWDALICTSQAVRRSLDHLLESWSEYLAERVGGRPHTPIQLPVIPLGVDCDAFEPRAENVAAGRALRKSLNIAAEDVVVLWVGRLSFHAKAHPLPMYRGLEEAAKRTGRKVHLLLAGWFANKSLEEAFTTGARAWCPTVRTVFLDGRQEKVMRAVWFAADLATSLVDNIQETFGLAPIEAMAAGLPQVVSDWDGFRDTVRHGVDGFRIPTTLPPCGSGEELIGRYFADEDTYDHYVGNVSQCTAVDTAACADAFARLISNDELRRTMGQAARRRARERYDWSVVIKAYEQLWRELQNRRQHADETAPRRPTDPPHPLRDDPFSAFAAYPTETLNMETLLTSTPSSNAARLDKLLKTPMTNFAAPLLASREECLQTLDQIGRNGGCTLGEVLTDVPAPRLARMQRTIGWLLKTDLLQMGGPPSD